MSRHPTAPPPAPSLPVTFQVGRHQVRIEGQPGRWATSVDGVALAGAFSSSADAWEAGVREADRLDRLPAG